MDSIPEHIAYVAGRMFERRLTDMAGGNVSARDDSRIYISPRFSGSRRHWQLKPEDIISGSTDNDDLLENPNFSREGRAHLAVYRNFPDVTGYHPCPPFSRFTLLRGREAH